MDIFYNITNQYRVTEKGARDTNSPLLRYREQPVWWLHLVDEINTPVDLSEVPSWRAAVDIDLNSKTEVMCRTLNDVIDKSRLAEGAVGVPIDANTENFLEKVDGKDNVSAKFELWGYDSNGAKRIYLRLAILVSAVVDPEGGDLPSPVDPDEAVRKTELEAMISRELIFEYSPDKTQIHTELTEGDVYQRVRHGENGVPSDWQKIPYGPSGTGTPGAAATIKIGSVADVEYDETAQVQNSGNENAAIFDFKLRCGKPGRDGADGASFSYNASGEPSERGAYDGESAGFVFACTVNDPENRTCTWYFYKKKSDAFADWYPPLVKVEYPGLDGENAKLIPVVNFQYPENLSEDSLKYLYFAQTDYPAAWIAAVVIDTENGELQLPYFHDQGVRKIEKRDGVFYIYFGANVPQFETGRIYFAQGTCATGESGGSGGDTPSVSAKIYYGYVPYEVAGDNTESVAAITLAMLTDEDSSITQADAVAMGKTSLGNVPAGAWTVVMIPKAANLEALKFDGIGGYTEFALDNGFENSGANGAEILLGDVPYLVYGQFNLAASELFFTVQERN